MRAPASEVRQKPIVPAHFFLRFLPATVVCLGSFDWLGSNLVPLPDLYFDSFSYSVTPIVSSAGGIV